MILLGGRNYRSFFENNYKVYFFSTNDVYRIEIGFPKSEDIVVFFGSMTLKELYGEQKIVDTDKLYKNLRSIRNKKIIFISSASVYGLSINQKGFTSTDRLLGVTSYALEKIAIEQFLIEETQRLVILRPSGFFGEVCGHMPKSFLNNLKLNLLGNQRVHYHIEHGGKQLRDFTHVGDLMECISYFCKAEVVSRCAFNVSSTEGMMIKSITQNVSNFTDKVTFEYDKTQKKRIHSFLEIDRKIRDLIPSQKNIFEFLKLQNF